MKFYIGQNNASGIEAKNWEEFIDYLHDEMLKSQENGDEYFTVTIENENSEYCAFLHEIHSKEKENSDASSSAFSVFDEERKMTKHIIGYKTFGDTIDITDPGYDHDVWCCKRGVKIVPGSYKCVAWEKNFPYENQDDIRVCLAGIYHTDSDSDDMIWSPKPIGQIGVDAGLAGFFQNKPDYAEDEWDDFCSKLDYAAGKAAWIFPEGFFTSSGFGDGCYYVYAAYNENDDIVALEIEFISPDDEDDED